MKPVVERVAATRRASHRVGPRPGGPSQTDWARVDALADADIDFSDIPEITPESFAGAVVRKGHQTQMNAVLRAFQEAHDPKP